jgi:hypothetical protein
VESGAPRTSLEVSCNSDEDNSDEDRASELRFLSGGTSVCTVAVVSSRLPAAAGP